MITYDDFKKLDMRIGLIRFVEPVEGTDKLLRCLVDMGPELATHWFVPGGEASDALIIEIPTASEDEAEGEDTDIPTQPEGALPVRQIVSGIREYLDDPAEIRGKQVLYVVNLEPRTIRGVKSYGMLMAVGDEDTAFSFLTPDQKVQPGAKIR